MPETSIAEVISLMRVYHCDGMPVTVDKQLIGYVQLTSVLAIFVVEGQLSMKQALDLDPKHLQSRLAPLLRATVKQVMDDTKASVSMLMTVNEAMSIMLDQQISHLAVTEDNRVVGTISIDDVSKAIPGITSTKVTA